MHIKVLNNTFMCIFNDTLEQWSQLSLYFEMCSGAAQVEVQIYHI